MKQKVLKLLLSLCVTPFAHNAAAAEVNGLTNFAAGTPAVASEVNGNFVAVKAAVDNNHATIATLAATVATLQSTVADLQAKLAGVTRETVNGQPTFRFTGVNVQIVNGSGFTSGVNGVGNLIIGYDEPFNLTIRELCSVGADSSGALIRDAAACSAVGGTFAFSHKSGSHNLIVGDHHNYSSHAGVALGRRNSILNPYAVVTGGTDNVAAGEGSSVSGGSGNQSLFFFSSVSGGRTNKASGQDSSVSGGFANSAKARHSSVSGGRSNEAIGIESRVVGRTLNNANGLGSTVGGGRLRNATGADDWVSGGLFQDN